jgi:hypothetical protein
VRKKPLLANKKILLSNINQKDKLQAYLISTLFINSYNKPEEGQLLFLLILLLTMLAILNSKYLSNEIMTCKKLLTMNQVSLFINFIPYCKKSKSQNQLSLFEIHFTDPQNPQKPMCYLP